MMRTLLAAAFLAAVAAPAAAQTNAVVLPSDPGLRAVACAGVLDGVSRSIAPNGGNAMADELKAFSGRWTVQAKALGAGVGRSASDIDQAIAAQSTAVNAGAGQGLAPKSFEAAQACQAEAENLPAS